MKTGELGKLVKVDLRAYWKEEARDFTPWLAEHISLLGDAIGLDELEVEEIESKVGNFSADILCRNNVDGHLVIVENQFGKTDHDHLGKLLTYAAGKGAATLVWVTEEFREEHRATIDWLNEHTSEGIHFFGVQMELWKIGDSRPAPQFHVVCKPNNWTETVRHADSNADKLRFSFWQRFLEVADWRQGSLRSRAPSKIDWMSFPIGRSGFHLSALVGIQKSQIGVRLIMDGKAAKAHYRLLLQQKDEVEREIGQPLEWRELPDNKQKQVNLWRKDCNVSNEQEWGDFHTWLHEYLEKFHAAFHQRIQDLDADACQSPDAQDEDD